MKAFLLGFLAVAFACTNYSVTASALNIRSGPGTGYKVTGTAKQGQILCVESISGSWAKLNTGKYASSTYLKKVSTPAPPPAPSSCTNYYVTANSLNIRNGPGTGHAISGTASKGQTLCVVSTANGWAKLNTGKYASTQYLSKTNPGSSTPTTPGTPSASGDKRKCPSFWNAYASNRYPTRNEYAAGLKKVVGKHVNYTQGGQRWYGIKNKVCPPSAPTWADCSSFSTWGLWTAFGGLTDIVNKQSWNAGYTGTMETYGKKVSSSSSGCLPGDLILYPGHVATYVGGNQVVNYGATGPVKLLAYNYKGIKGCYRYDFPFGAKF